MLHRLLGNCILENHIKLVGKRLTLRIFLKPGLPISCKDRKHVCKHVFKLSAYALVFT